MSSSPAEAADARAAARAPGATAPRSAAKPRMLCVDDEPRVLEGLALVLRRHFELRTATSGAEALAMLDAPWQPAVIMSDMRMPSMDGAAFLAAACVKAPDAVRLLLTGQADMNSAISAVNDGQIFRFLTKPCPPPALLAAATAAAAQHRLITAEKELLEQTLLGSLKALTDILAISNPQLFGRAQRLRQLVRDLCAADGRSPPWTLDAACMLTQIGSVALPPEVGAKLARGQTLEPRESQMVANAGPLSVRLLANIPRLESVIALLEGMQTRWSMQTRAQVEPNPGLARDAQWLRAVSAYVGLESAGVTAAQAIATLRAELGDHDPQVLDALQALLVSDQPPPVRECSLRELEPGMVLAQDVHLPNGTLLVSRGYEITPGLLERLDNFGETLQGLQFRVAI